MEFWGLEVKPGQTVKCEPGEERLLHLSQAALGETKDKGVENVTIYVKFDDQKLVIGTLSLEKCAQISYDLVFEKEFELSHSSKNVSVYFCGYKSDQQYEEMEDDMFSESEEEEDVQLAGNANGKPSKAQGAKPTTVKSTEEKVSAGGKAKAKSGSAKAEPKATEENDEDDDDEDDSDGSDDDEDMMKAMADSDEEDNSDDEDSDDDEDGEDDEDSEEEEEATPKKSANGKKRPVESASKTPVPEKKAKVVTPAGQKTGGDGKKNVHVATPHPAKQPGKTPANTEKAKPTSKSGGSINCKSCPKSFSSENALQAHTKAKHGDAK